MARSREVAGSGIILIRSNHVDHSLQRAADRINAMKFEEYLLKKAVSHLAINPGALQDQP